MSSREEHPAQTWSSQKAVRSIVVTVLAYLHVQPIFFAALDETPFRHWRRRDSVVSYQVYPYLTSRDDPRHGSVKSNKE